METFYTVEETAEILKVSAVTVKRMLLQGRLRGVKIGKLWRIPESAIDGLAKGNESNER